MIKFFHKLLNPHCPDCVAEANNNKICPTCDVYRVQLDLANYDKKKLLELIEKMNNPPVAEEKEPPLEVKPIQSRSVPWNVRKNMLETEDKLAAEKLRAKAAEIKDDSEKLDDLEKEVGVK